MKLLKMKVVRKKITNESKKGILRKFPAWPLLALDNVPGTIEPKKLEGF